MIGVLLYLLLLTLMLGFVWWLSNVLAIPEPARVVLQVVLLVVFIAGIVGILGSGLNLGWSEPIVVR